MEMPYRRTAILALGLLAGAAGAQDLTPEQLFTRLAPSVWTIETADAQSRPLATGSGVVVGPGSVVTNCHVLEKAKKVAVARENISYGASLEHADPERDLCLLRVRNFPAPAVTIGDADQLRVGARVYAIGSPQGLEQTISDGLLSGVRKFADGSYFGLQITVPISPGSSGGGLFDARGRLVGITTFSRKDSQNLNFALPANWIAEVPERARAAAAKRGPDASAAATPAPPAQRGALAVGTRFEYRITDRVTRATRNVVYRVDRIEGNRVEFNNGARVEDLDGKVLHLQGPIAGESDFFLPPEGWLRKDASVGTSWKVKYETPRQPRRTLLNLQAKVIGEQPFALGDRQIPAVQVEYTGYIDYTPGTPGAGTGRYRATAWYAPEFKRLVRFEIYARGGSAGGQFTISEVMELVSVR